MSPLGLLGACVPGADAFQALRIQCSVLFKNTKSGTINRSGKNAKHRHLRSRFKTFLLRRHCFFHDFFDLWETSIHHTVLLKLGMAGPCTACDKYRQDCSLSPRLAFFSLRYLFSTFLYILTLS